jgi:molybdopterin synthase catalytic subunit
LSRLEGGTQFNEHLERMANPVCNVFLTKERLELPREDVDLAAGAIVDFWGVVRSLEDDREIEGIEYEVHWVMAQHQLEKVAQQAAFDFKLGLVVIHHRVGFVRAGEASLLVRVASRHRAEAFRANHWIVDELKQRAPIWKQPRFKTKNQRRASHSEAATAK